jgi:MoaA/NifB/PqqE/SkfB family radical SAM enzyme
VEVFGMVLKDKKNKSKIITVKKIFYTNRDISPKYFLFPITHKCNSKCVMCNIWKIKTPEELTLNQIRQLFDDPSFKSIEKVIISGGEATLRNDVDDILAIIVSKCPKLKSIDIATNGLNPNQTLTLCRTLERLCISRNIQYSFMISIDGVQEVHDKVRGVPGAFKKACQTLEAMKELQVSFKFDLHINCVVTQYNVYTFSELFDWCNKRDISLSFQLAHEWSRFHNQKCDFQLSPIQKEFYLNLLWKKNKGLSGSYYDWMTYRMFSANTHRSLNCAFLRNAFTITPDGDVYYCPNSRSIGNIGEDSFSNIYYNKTNLKYRNSLTSSCRYCHQTCWWYESLQADIIEQTRFAIIKKLMNLVR